MRGFDHIELLLSYWLLNSQYSSKIKFNTIIKYIDTKSQALNKLNARNETKNDIYKANYNFTNLKVLIIDDVVTTGNTINNLAYFIKQQGAKQVDCACLMRTQFNT